MGTIPVEIKEVNPFNNTIIVTSEEGEKYTLPLDNCYFGLDWTLPKSKGMLMYRYYDLPLLRSIKINKKYVPL